jgi:hypothetical protein
MFNSKKPEKTYHFNQLKLWEIAVQDPGPRLKASMNEAIKQCPLSREQVVDEMNKLALSSGITCNGRSQKITPALIAKWLAPSSQNYFIPIRLLPIFCRVVGSNLPLQALASFFEDVRIISKDDFKKLEWAKAEISARKSRKQASILAQEAGL